MVIISKVVNKAAKHLLNGKAVAPDQTRASNAPHLHQNTSARQLSCKYPLYMATVWTGPVTAASKNVE